MKKSIYYVGFYPDIHGRSNRVYHISAKNKMDYIISVLNDLSYSVTVVSPSWNDLVGRSQSSIQKENKTDKNSHGNRFVYAPNFKSINKCVRNINIIIAITWIFLYSVFNFKNKDVVLVYHVPWLSLPIRAAKKIKNFDLILEVEEIYQDIQIPFKTFKVWEDLLIDSADRYIYSTDLLRNRITNKKKNIILYGSYDFFNTRSPKFEDGKIHLVYAGIIDSHKKGAFIALESCRFLGSNYHLHIIGFGQVDLLQEKIQDHNLKYECKVSYDGLLKGEEYNRFMLKCDIGLSTQITKGKYLESSFPSKILSYLSFNLRIVSGNIPSIKESKVGDLIDFYHEETPESISQTIQKIDLNMKFDGKSRLEHLEKTFKHELKNIVEE